MRFSIWGQTNQSWADLLDIAQYADTGSWRAFYAADHFMSHADTAEQRTDFHEATAIFAALAAATSRIRLAPLVLSMTFRHPAVLANWAATVDHVSRGRFTLGLGAGWQENEHQRYGLELGKPGPRVDRFSEGLQVITGLLNEQVTTVKGDFYQLAEGICEPKPVQQPLPILIGATQPRMLGLTARYAQEWNQWSSPGSFHEVSSRLDAAAEKIDRDPATIWRSTQARIIVTNDPQSEARAAETAAASPIPVLYGTAERIAEQMAPWAQEGVDEVILPDHLLGNGSARRDAYDALAQALRPLAE
ncbi:LLM class flavin-dependent oxidoreductase [Mycobacteroides saopaulense]|uniref:Luciferase n=1 Tax=Mycobacteroides saopaulense TaxID=1578165 RepID=A0ABX3BW68_9MYCO|nr:LLM class flavin-dependent oxidoreductase [Mycobacteroides saopaulense]OHT80058.1 luciferase [Mycobacteroides saopaulense]OHU06981.1 luciferase [Mycobacteroides saopaulense]